MTLFGSNSIDPVGYTEQRPGRARLRELIWGVAVDFLQRAST